MPPQVEVPFKGPLAVAVGVVVDLLDLAEQFDADPLGIGEVDRGGVTGAVEAADLMRLKAAALFDAGQPCGPGANMAKFLGAEAAWQAANACMDTYGGYGFCNEYDVERKFRETRLFITAPVTNNLVLACVGQHVLGMPRSY